jgi:hypothetical protein
MGAATRGSRACTHAGQQNVDGTARAQGAGGGCGQARSQRAQRLGSRNLTRFRRSEQGRVREQQRRHAGQQSMHAAERTQGAGRGCGQARSQRARRLGSRNLTTFCRGELGRMREQQRRHAGQQSVHAAERAQGAGRGCILDDGDGWALLGVGIPNPAACRRPLRPPLRRRVERERLGDAVPERSTSTGCVTVAPSITPAYLPKNV